MQRIRDFIVGIGMLTLCMGGSFLVSVSDIYAQNVFSPSDIQMKFSPTVPGTHQQVTVTLESYVINLDLANITWFVNGEEKESGTGMRRFVFTTGSSGDVFDIYATIMWGQGRTLSKGIRVQPVDLLMLWQSVDGYAPPFYRGKVLPTSESSIRIAALPMIGSLDDQFTYTWRRNDVTDQQQSGFRRTFFTIKNNFFQDFFRASVDTLSRDGRYHMQQSITVPRFQPKIIFEIQHPDGTSTWASSGSTVQAGRPDTIIRAHPMYFSSPDAREQLTYVWKVQDQPVSPDRTTPHTIAVSIPPQSSGIVPVTVQITHDINILQEATGTVNLRIR